MFKKKWTIVPVSKWYKLKGIDILKKEVIIEEFKILPIQDQDYFFYFSNF